MEPIGIAGSVLVVLQFHQRSLCLRAQTGYDPRSWIGLLEVVDRPHPKEVEHLVGICLPLDEGRQRASIVILDELHQRPRELRFVGRCWRIRDLASVPQISFKPFLQGATYAQQVRLPFKLVVDVLEPSVVQLVKSPQTDLRVLGVVRRDRLQHSPFCGCRPHGFEEDIAEGASRLGEQHRHLVPRANRWKTPAGGGEPIRCRRAW